MSANGESKRVPPRGYKSRRSPLATQAGLIAEMTRLYRLARRGKMDPSEARSHIWCLERIGVRLEALVLEKIETRLAELGGGRVILNGHEVDDQPAQLTN